jgi:hypothetical protein
MNRVVLAGVIASFGPSAAHAQLRVEPTVLAGVFTPAASLGEYGTARGRMRAAPIFGLALDLLDRGSPFGGRISGILAVTDGARFEPTASCRLYCRAYTSEYDAFRAFAIDGTLRFPLAGAEIRLAAGPGYRGYYVDDLVCACDPPLPGEFEPFSVRESQPAAHFAVELTRRVGDADIGLQLQDYWSRFELTGRGQHDLLVLITARLR